MKRMLNLLLAFAVLTMTGCSAVSFGVEGLINAPKLTKQQSEIHKALEKSIGSDITLKYPKNGDNRSAYVVSNIDNEAGNEAIVFYEYNSTVKKEGLWLSVLDNNEDDDWVCMAEVSCPGTDISKVVISSMGSENNKNVIVGYQNIAGEEKALEVYRYDNGEFKSICSDNYSVLETISISKKNHNGFVLIQKNVVDEIITYKAYLYEMENKHLVKSNGVDMSNDVVSYVNSKTGRLDDNSQAIYLDYLNADNNLRTEILYLNDGKLYNPVTVDKKGFGTRFNRPSGYYSMDIDKDGQIEIPSVRPMLGYENAVEQDLEYMSTWSVYDKKKGIVDKASGYYSLSDGFVMIYPNRWNDIVTMKKALNSGEIVFYKYNGDINAEMTELMRVASVGKNDVREYADRGYKIIDSKGQLDYMVKLPDDSNEPLVLTIDEIQNSFYTVE